ncbi:hypothetical protein Tco_0002733 [Tanacetum coccineum]
MVTFTRAQGQWSYSLCCKKIVVAALKQTNETLIHKAQTQINAASDWDGTWGRINDITSKFGVYDNAPDIIFNDCIKAACVQSIWEEDVHRKIHDLNFRGSLDFIRLYDEVRARTLADYKEYKISQADFKNLHLNDFEDLYLLHLQGNIVIRKHVEDLQLRIESYQTKLNLTQLDWDASDFLFKEDYTVVSKPRDAIYKDRNEQKKMMQETEVHKFSDGTLCRIQDKLDYKVKDF